VSIGLNVSNLLNGVNGMARHAVLLCLLLLAACVSETTTRRTGQFPWKEPADEQEPAPAPPRTSGKGVVELPQELLEKLMQFMNTQKFIVADRIEVDASRIPFQAAMVPVNDPAYVESVEISNPGHRVIGQLHRKREPTGTTPRDFPKLRIGDGIDLVASREIQVRSFLEVNENRPVFLRIRGIGHAVFQNPMTGERIERDAITMTAEVVRAAGGLRYRESVR